MARYMLFILARESVKDEFPFATEFMSRMRPDVPAAELIGEEEGPVDNWFSIYWKDVRPSQIEAASSTSSFRYMMTWARLRAYAASSHISLTQLEYDDLVQLRNVVAPAQLLDLFHYQKKGLSKFVLVTFEDSEP